MIAHAIPKPEILSTTLEIEHRGEFCGTKGMLQEKGARLQPYEIHESPEGASLTHWIAESIMRQLPWCQPRVRRLNQLEANCKAFSAIVLHGDPGRRIAGSPAHVALGWEVFDQARPSPHPIRHSFLPRWRLSLTTGRGP